jgi:NAD(P)-dependent dehydrogenase (short-subunit alcohol dehydrogenase family)
VAVAVERFGGLDIAVANAGIASTVQTARTCEETVFERTIEVNLIGIWRTVRACLPEIVARRGHITLVSSIYAFVNGALVLPYATAKAGAEQMGRALRVELAPHGVSVGVAYFGFVETDMLRQSLLDDPLADRMRVLVPLPLRKRLTADGAGEAVARGIERRAPRTTSPRRWAILSVLRGLNPLVDAAMLREPRFQALLREVEARATPAESAENRS